MAAQADQDRQPFLVAAVDHGEVSEGLVRSEMGRWTGQPPVQGWKSKLASAYTSPKLSQGGSYTGVATFPTPPIGMSVVPRQRDPGLTSFAAAAIVGIAARTAISGR
jgi:hypothetical protein